MVSINPVGRSRADLAVIQSVGDPRERNFGKISWVMHEKESPDIHVEVSVIEATEEAGVTELLDPGRASVVKPN